MKIWNGEKGYREETRPSVRFRLFVPKNARQHLRCPALFGERGIIFVLLIPQQRARSQQGPFQLHKCAEQLIRMHKVAAPFAMGITDPTPAVSSNYSAIALRPAGGAELVSYGFPVFRWRHDARVS